MINENAKEVRTPIVIRGAGVGRGIAIGPLRLGPMRSESRLLRIDGEMSLLGRAVAEAREELRKMEARAVERVGDEHGEIYRLLLSELEGGEYLDRVRDGIEGGERFPIVTELVARQFAKDAEADGGREAKVRAARARELSSFLREASENVSGGGGLSTNGFSNEEIPEKENRKYILVASDVDGFLMRRNDIGDIIGIVSVGGAEGAGLAAYAKAKGIPALVISASDAPSGRFDGAGAIIDPERGRLTINPDLAALDKFTESSREAEENEERLAAFIGLPSVTRSGRHVSLIAEVSEEEGISDAISADAEGVCVLVTEAEDDEEKRYEMYKKAIDGFRGKHVLAALYHPRDERGGFGIRHLLEDRSTLKSRLRSVLRGAGHGSLTLAISGAVSPEDIRRVRAVLMETASEMKNDGIPFGDRLNLGAILDTPAAVLCGELIAPEVDLFIADSDAISSLALNADKKFSSSAEVVRRNPESTLRLIEIASKAIHASGKGKLMGVAGDMAFDRSLTDRLVAMGVDMLFVPPPYVLDMREKIRECSE